RLAETYLLRAEAYLNKGDKANAAKDINAVRDRSQAPRVDAADVDIDYILDERLRELTFEEFRMLTLCRMGKLVERTKKYNYSFNGLDGNPVESSGMSMEEYHNLWPIPYNEIERNTEAVLEQNPGYTN
ncbi:MAG: RagB/SusD family nutrient uptake outer membrane protein, partial [Tannerella sp.]|nr:RagB/SusD family nutrient uptake outer membrane protein [Tannerella sp.]